MVPRCDKESRRQKDSSVPQQPFWTLPLSFSCLLTFTQLIISLPLFIITISRRGMPTLPLHLPPLKRHVLQLLGSRSDGSHGPQLASRSGTNLSSVCSICKETVCALRFLLWRTETVHALCSTKFVHTKTKKNRTHLLITSLPFTS